MTTYSSKSVTFHSDGRSKANLQVKDAIMVSWRNRTNASVGPTDFTVAFKDDIHEVIHLQVSPSERGG